MRRPWFLLVVLPLGVLLGGCTASPTAADDPPATAPPRPEPRAYTGPLVVRQPSSGAAGLREWPGAAGRAVQCRGHVIGGSHAAPYADGEVRDDIQGALHEAFGEGQIDGVQEGLREVRRAGSRVLLTFESDGIAVEAVVMRRGPVLPRAGAGPDGVAWWPESFARCDWADFPESVTAARGMQIWRDASGARVPTTSVMSAAGPAHCGWESMTFLHLGGVRIGDAYVRDPQPDLSEFFAQPFQAHRTVPADARDTGYSRGGNRLWLAADRAVVYVGASPSDAEQWPRTVKPLACA